MCLRDSVILPSLKRCIQVFSYTLPHFSAVMLSFHSAATWEMAIDTQPLVGLCGRFGGPSYSCLVSLCNVI